MAFLKIRIIKREHVFPAKRVAETPDVLCVSVQKKIEMCALCKEYPCDKFDEFFKGYPILKSDNDIIRKDGLVRWAEIQDERKEKGFAYSD